MSPAATVEIATQLRDAGERREERAREAVRAATGPGLLRLAKAYLPEEPALARRLAEDIAELCMVAARAALEARPTIEGLPPGAAPLLDRRGEHQVIPVPAPTSPALDVDRVLAAARIVAHEGEARRDHVPRALAFAILDLSAAIGGAP